MRPSSFSSALQIFAFVALAISADYNQCYGAEALEFEEYDIRVKRARLVAGAMSRNSDRHLRSGQHPEANPGHNRQRDRHSDAAYIPSQRVTQTLHIHQEKGQHEPMRNQHQQQRQRQNDDHHQRQQQQANDSDDQQHREHNNLRNHANDGTQRHTPDDESSREDDSKNATPKAASDAALARDEPAASTTTNTIGSNIDGAVREDMIKQYIDSPNAASS